MKLFDFNKIITQSIPLKTLSEKGISLDILRIDALHPIVSGNKWFKLKYNIEEAISQGFDTMATFGGAYSNHIIASAFACKSMGLNSVGIIRGEEPKKWSHTLQQAKEAGMKLIFKTRSQFNNKETIKEEQNDHNWYWVNEGGYGLNGAKGAAEIFNWIDDSYTHILCATGTGTMMAGLIKAAKQSQTVIGINALKHEALLNDIQELLTLEDKAKKFELINDYHFGGYAKHPPQLLNFIKEVWHQYQLPTDIVYTAKLLYGTIDLLKKEYFPPNSKIMVIHSGGLQGNLSLPINTLPFSITT